MQRMAKLAPAGNLHAGHFLVARNIFCEMASHLTNEGQARYEKLESWNDEMKRGGQTMVG